MSPTTPISKQNIPRPTLNRRRRRTRPASPSDRKRRQAQAREMTSQSHTRPRRINKTPDKMAPQPGECPEDLARPASLAVDPRVDPYRDGAFLWVRGALQALAILAGPVATLREIPNQRAITSALLELLNALAPACLESHIPETDQELALTLLGEYCGYGEFAGQLARRWAEADARRNGTQLDMVQWLSDNAGSPKSPETQAETRIPAPNGNAAEANP